VAAFVFDSFSAHVHFLDEASEKKGHTIGITLLDDCVAKRLPLLVIDAHVMDEARGGPFQVRVIHRRGDVSR